MLEYLATKGLTVLPFMIVKGGIRSFDMQRIAESLLIAVVTAVATMYSTQRVIENELAHIKDNQIRQMADQAEMRAKVNTAILVQQSLIPLREEQMRNLDKRLSKLERGRI